MNLSFAQSNMELCDQPFTDGAEFLNSKATSDQTFIDQKVAKSESTNDTIFAKKTQPVTEKPNFLVQTEQKSLLTQGGEESPSIAAKKMRFEQPNEINRMDVDTPTENIFLHKQDLDEIFKGNLDELMALEKKLSEWLDGIWLPSKDDALQLLTSSIILKQRFLDMCKKTRETGKVKNALEISKMLVQQIKDSISECDACSLELMDYDTCSLAMEKMSIDSNGTDKGANHQVDWPMNFQIQETPACEWSPGVNKENFSKSSTLADPSQEDFSENSASTYLSQENCSEKSASVNLSPENFLENSASAYLSQENCSEESASANLSPENFSENSTSANPSQENFPQNSASAKLSQENFTKNSASVNESQEDDEPNSNVPDDVPRKIDPAVRAAKVRAIRAVLLPRILHMLDNYDEWSKEHHSDVMCEFLDMKHDEMRRQKRSVDDNRAASERRAFFARGSALKYHDVKAK